MNQHIHKVIFNKTTGRMDVVSEIVSAQGGATLASANESPNPAWHHSITQFLIKPVAFALMLSLGTAQILPAHAQVIADPSAPPTQQPTILPTASGATQINIQTPSAAGVSMNQYKQFDTQTNGTVLNNSRTNTNTQTAGWIQANPWLATGSAQVIVNQVNSSNPSRLTGNIEVAGQRADLIIANPSGININGAAIINANRTTFTTGVPQLNNGSLTGYQVNQGQINIEGTGLNATGSDYTDLLARAVKVNAGIWANNLAITTGANNINATNDNITPSSQVTANTSTAPSLAIDTSALGGMYAGKITLIGTEKGVGVNNAGQIAASAGNVTIDANGMLSNSGTINSNGAENATQIKSTQLANTGSISSQGNTQIQTAGLTNSGTIAAGREAKLTATDLNNSTGTINGQRIDITANSLNNTQGKIQQTGTQALALTTGSLSNTNNGLIGYEPLDAGSGTGTGTGSTGTGTTTAPSTAAGGGSSTVVQPVPVVLADGQISVQTSLNNDGGRITANGGIDLTVSNGLENHATLNLNKLNVTGDTLNNSSGRINSTQTAVTVNTVNNVAGQIQTAGNSHIQANRLDNRTGLIRSEQGNTLVVNSIDNSNTQGTDQGIEGNTVAIQGSQLNNSLGAIRAKTDLTAQITDNINNTQGLISSNGTLNIKDNQANTLAITNTAGQIISEGNHSIQAKGLTGDGTVTSNTDLNIQLADSFNNAGTTSAVGNLTFTTTGDLTNVTALKAGNSVSIGAQNIDNKAGAEISSAKTQLTVNDTLTNRGLIDGGDTFIQANTVNNVGTGRIYGDHIAIGAGTLNNLDETVNGTKTAATIAARNRLDLGVQNLLNQEHSLIYSDGLMSIGGSLDGNHQAMGSAANIVNTSATIESMGDMQINAQTLLNSNAHFTIKRVSVGSPVDSMLISPQGDPNKYDISNFTWRNWSRAGLYVWNNNPTVAVGTELGKTPILSLGEQTCSNPADESTCRVVAGAEYPASDPAWNYFGVPAPEAEPMAPDLVEPVRPTLTEPVAVPSTDPNYAQYLSDKAAYDAAMANYNQLQAQYIAAHADYQAAHDAWFADTDDKYAALADKVEIYNAQFGGEIKAWTQYQLTQTQQEDQVNTSDPALIRSGGSMFLTGGTVTNDKSAVIAGGSMLGTLNAIKNIDGKGEHVTYFDGTSQYTRSRWRGGFKRYHQRDWDSKQPYHDEIHQLIDIPVAQVLENTASTGSGTNVGDKQIGPSVQVVASGAAVSSVDVNTTMPNSSLYTTNPDNPDYLIQTDPRFANYHHWLSSDWMLDALRLDPASVHKRLGDGYYEQKLIRDQVAQLTGRRYLGDYQNDEEQYKALMNSGVTFAQSYNLRPGIALTAAQVAQLTSDIVWLETQTVTLPNGSTQQVLVPKLYTMVRTGDISNSGALLSGNNVQLKLNSDLDNSGTIAGRNIVNLSANNLDNSGNIVGQQIALQADKDINITGGTVSAQDTLSAVAGNDLNVTTTTQTTNQHDHTFDTQRTSIERVAGLYVSAPAGQMLLVAGKDITLTGADIASGTAVVSAGNHLTLNTVTTGHSESMQADAKNYRKQSNTQEVGTNINTVGNLSLQAQGQLTATAVNLDSQTGTLSMYGKDGVTIQNGMASDTFDEGHYHKTSGVLSSKSTETRIHQDSTQVMASDVTGAQVIIQSGKDLNIIGSNVVSDNLTQLTAQNNLNILSAQNTSTQTQFEETKKSGLMGTGGIGFMVGKTQNSTDTDNTNITHTGSMVASNQGDVRISAGNTLNVKGSDIQAHDDLSAIAQTINITAETNRYTQATEQKSKSSGLTVSLSGTIGNAANGVIAAVQQGNSANDRGNDRLAAAYDTKATLIAAQAAQSVNKDVTDISDANKATQGSVIGISVSVGSSRSQSNSASQTTVAKGSNLTAGNHLTLTATGDGTKGADGYANNGDLNIQGSSVSAKAVDLNAARDVNLTSAANTNTETSSNSSSGWAVGANIGVSASGSMGISVFANANKGKGNANGNGVTHTETQINASDKLNIHSGRDANLIGAQAHGTTVNADIGRDLTITSEQDSSNYNSKQTNMSAGVEIPVYGVSSPSASFNMSKQKIDSNYNSVNEQSGLFAGNGGFNVNVDGHTQLNGGAIVSDAPKDKNTLNTGSLGITQLDNTSQYKASNSGIGISTGSLTDIAKGALMAQIPQALNGGEDASSTTQAAISPANVTIGGKAATAEQLKDVATSANANSLATIFDVQAVQDQMELASTVGDVGALATNVVSTAMQREAYVARDHAMAEAEAHLTPAQLAVYNSKDYQEHPEKKAAYLVNLSIQQNFAEVVADNPYLAAKLANPNLTTSQKQTIIDNLSRGGMLGNVAQANIDYEDTQRQYGPGSDFFRASQALTGLATGLASGNVAQGLSNAAAPYLANQVGSYFDGLVNEAKAKGESIDGIEAARALAHAATGAAIAYMSGNNATSGAVGAVSGELMTKFAAQSLYPDKTLDQLTVAERNQVIAVAALASGLVGGAAGGSFEGAAVSAAAGYNAAVNNALLLNPLSGTKALLAGFTQGIGGKLKDDVSGLWQMAKHPINTLKSIKDLLSSPSAVLALGKDEVNRQLNEINYLIASYSDFDANLTDYQAEQLGIRTGHFVTGVAELAAGAGGAVKSVAQLTEKLAAKFAVKETALVSIELGVKNVVKDIPNFVVGKQQLGKKLGEHVQDFGGNPSNIADRQKVIEIIQDIADHPDTVINGTFAGQGQNGARGAVHFRIKGNDVVVTKPSGEFVTILKDGVNNPSVKSALEGN